MSRPDYDRVASILITVSLRILREREAQQRGREDDEC